MNSQLSAQLQLLPEYLSAHIVLSLLALALGIVICVPLGAFITRLPRVQWLTLSIAGILQTVPGIALLALMVPLLGMIGFIPALLALTLYSFLPILRNSVTGITEVDDALIEAATGIGMTDWQVLTKVQLPLALPMIVAGIRTAAVWVVGTATLATPVGAVSLGNFIFAGLQTQNVTAILVGCLAAAILAIVIDMSIRAIEVALTRRRVALSISGLAGIGLLALAALWQPLTASVANSDAESDRPVVIGAKTFSEQYILAELLAQRLEAAGRSTSVRSGMGSIILFDALANSDVDCYVDYTGTIWANAMQRRGIAPRRAVYDTMVAWLDSAYGIHTLGPLGFENTYALAVRRETAEQYNLQTIEDLTAVAGELTIGSDYEFYDRPEWQRLQSTYNLEMGDRRTFDPTLMYQAVATGDVDVITAYSTDGRIIAFDLVVLEDTRQAFPPYDAVLLLSPDASADNRLIAVLKNLIDAVNATRMREANKAVDIDQIAIDSVAHVLSEQLRGKGG